MTGAAVAIFTHLLVRERLGGDEVAALDGGPAAAADLAALGLIEPDADGYRMSAWARARFPLTDTAEPDPEWIGHDPEESIRRLAGGWPGDGED